MPQKTTKEQSTFLKGGAFKSVVESKCGENGLDGRGGWPEIIRSGQLPLSSAAVKPSQKSPASRGALLSRQLNCILGLVVVFILLRPLVFVARIAEPAF